MKKGKKKLLAIKSRSTQNLPIPGGKAMTSLDGKGGKEEWVYKSNDLIWKGATKLATKASLHIKE